MRCRTGSAASAAQACESVTSSSTAVNVGGGRSAQAPRPAGSSTQLPTACARRAVAQRVRAAQCSRRLFGRSDSATGPQRCGGPLRALAPPYLNRQCDRTLGVMGHLGRRCLSI